MQGINGLLQILGPQKNGGLCSRTGRMPPGHGPVHRRDLRSREDSNCDLCPSQLEADAHIFVDCSRAREIWLRLDHVPLSGQ